MAASPETPARSNTAGLPPEDDNIDKVRDILLGSQTRQIEKRLAAMQDKIDKEIGYLRSEIKTTLDSLFISSSALHWTNTMAMPLL
jgi:hypothetical protein